jgi:hypothetical protein
LARDFGSSLSLSHVGLGIVSHASNACDVT